MTPILYNGPWNKMCPAHVHIMIIYFHDIHLLQRGPIYPAIKRLLMLHRPVLLNTSRGVADIWWVTQRVYFSYCWCIIDTESFILWDQWRIKAVLSRSFPSQVSGPLTHCTILPASFILSHRLWYHQFSLKVVAQYKGKINMTGSK